MDERDLNALIRMGAEVERCAAEREFDALLAGEGTSELAGQ